MLLKKVLDETGMEVSQVNMVSYRQKYEIYIILPNKKTSRSISTPDNTSLRFVEHVRLLEAYINSSLNWTLHVDHMINKTAETLLIIYRGTQWYTRDIICVVSEHNWNMELPCDIQDQQNALSILN